jgi:hypothetical protein
MMTQLNEISDPKAKYEAVTVAIDCINYVNSIRPDTITEETLACLAELKVDLLCMNNTN